MEIFERSECRNFGKHSKSINEHCAIHFPSAIVVVPLLVVGPNAGRKDCELH